MEKALLIIGNILSVIIAGILGVMGFFGLIFCDNPRWIGECFIIPGAFAMVGLLLIVFSGCSWLFYDSKKKTLRTAGKLFGMAPIFAIITVTIIFLSN